VLLTGLPSLFIPQAGSSGPLMVLRMIVGLGFGASLPVAAAFVSEYAPAKHRALFVTLTSSSVVVGMSLAGLGTSFIIPLFGWQAMTYAGGTASLLTACIAWFALPRARDAPTLPAAAVVDPPRRLPLSSLLTPALLIQSLLLCVTMMMAFLVMNFATYWLPTLLVNEGYSVSETGLLGSSRQLATVAMGFLIGWCMDRAGVGRVLMITHCVAVVLFLCIGAFALLPLFSMGLLMGGMTLVSAGLSGSMALISSTYDPSLRATALGWVQGVARVVGGTVGTYAGGLLVGAKWDQTQIAIAMGCAASVSAVTLFLARRRIGPRLG
jgi:MFS transporter, AAHS family, 4-hydroxybenzoate transporter